MTTLRKIALEVMEVYEGKFSGPFSSVPAGREVARLILGSGFSEDEVFEEINVMEHEEEL